MMATLSYTILLAVIYVIRRLISRRVLALQSARPQGFLRSA
jgi:hypothetical protein